MAALTAFANLGFRKTSMAVSAESIDTPRQRLYNRFAGKETTLLEAVSTLFDTDILSQLMDALYA